MPAAVAVPLIIGAASTGASIYAAKKGSDAAQNAANTQAQSGQQALDLQKQMFQQGQQNIGPYANAGYQGLFNAQQMLNRPVAPFNGSQPGGGWTAPPALPQAPPPVNPAQFSMGGASLTPQPTMNRPAPANPFQLLGWGR